MAAPKSVDPAGVLRAITEAARADPRVLAFAHESRRELEGDEPTTCHRGHRNGSGRHNMRRDLLPCGCGGHSRKYGGGHGCAVIMVDDVLDEHVALDIQCLNRIHLNAYAPNVQTSAQGPGAAMHRGTRLAESSEEVAS